VGNEVFWVINQLLALWSVLLNKHPELVEGCAPFDKLRALTAGNVS
jgi:hypothetical protein